MITCPACNTVNPDGPKFCVGCGAPLTAEPVRPPDSVTCPSCKAANPRDAQFCVSCGAPLPPPEAVPAAPLIETAAASYEPFPSAAYPGSAAWVPPAIALSASPAKQRGMALFLEILPACFGIFGIGWLYSGHTTAGTLWLVGMLIWESIGLALSVVTVGMGCMCFVPINLAVVALSAVLLNSYINQHPEQFSM